MKLSIIFLGIIFLKSSQAEVLECSSSLGLGISTMCRVSGGAVASDESLKISNANQDITTLTFSSTNFTAIPLNTFVNYPKVVVFYVSKNNLNSFPETSFTNASKLTTLFFSDNEIKQLPDQAFKLCTALTKISIYNNPISVLTGNPFQGAGKVQRMILGNLPIETFDPAALDDLTSLESLEMSNCSLTEITRNFCANNPRLTEVVISNNGIVSLEDGTFGTLKFLSSLDVSRNKLVSLSVTNVQTLIANKNLLKNLFIGSSVTSINVDDNFISNLTCDTSLKLITFYASNNRLSKALCIGKMTAARSISVDSNRLAKLNKNVFANLKNVTVFNINNNPKLKLGSKMITSMTSLRSLRVDSLATGYKNLRTLFPKMNEIYLTTKNWECTKVTNIANVLNTQKIYLYFNNATLDKANFKCNLNNFDVSHFNYTR